MIKIQLNSVVLEPGERKRIGSFSLYYLIGPFARKGYYTSVKSAVSIPNVISFPGMDPRRLPRQGAPGDREEPAQSLEAGGPLGGAVRGRETRGVGGADKGEKKLLQGTHNGLSF